MYTRFIWRSMPNCHNIQANSICTMTYLLRNIYYSVTIGFCTFPESMHFHPYMYINILKIHANLPPINVTTWRFSCNVHWKRHQVQSIFSWMKYIRMTQIHITGKYLTPCFLGIWACIYMQPFPFNRFLYQVSTYMCRLITKLVHIRAHFILLSLVQHALNPCCICMCALFFNHNY